MEWVIEFFKRKCTSYTFKLKACIHDGMGPVGILSEKAYPNPLALLEAHTQRHAQCLLQVCCVQRRGLLLKMKQTAKANICHLLSNHTAFNF